MENGFSVMHLMSPQPKTETYYLHSHEGYEFLLFLKGDSEYIVEGKTYKLEVGDAIISRRGEMHRIVHLSNSFYERIVINIFPEFFDINNCREYEKIFTDKSFLKNNKITAKIINESGIKSAAERLVNYSENGKRAEKPVVRAALTEFLYLLNNVKTFDKSDNLNPLVQNIISYINEHFCENVDLNNLASMFFVSKYYLCHLFKTATGHTIHSYINEKRLSALKDLCKRGISIGKAAALCGFSDYSSFYRFYVKKYGVSPKKDLKSG